MSGAATGRERAGWGMRLAAVGLGVAVGLAGLVWILPGALDWSAWRGSIARYASRELGRPVRIDGAISVTLLPAPLVVANDVHVADTGDGVSLAAPTLRLRLAPWPLLAGRLVPRALVLNGAAILLPWPLPAGLSGRSADWLQAASGRLGSARIENGTFSVGVVRLTGLDADLAAGESGVQMQGAGQAFGKRWRVEARLGQADALGSAPVEATLRTGGTDKAPAPDASVRFVGALAADGAVSGRLSAQADNLSRLMPAPPIAARAEGTVGVGGGPARAEISLDVGGVAVAARLRPAGGAQVLSLTAGVLDLDKWDAALARLRAGQDEAGMLSLPGRIALDVSAEALSLHGGLIRDVHASLDVDNHAGRLRAASATLPGEARLTLAGTLREDVFGLTLDGRGSVVAPDLRRTLRWLEACGLKLGDGLPDGVLREAVLRGEVLARRDQVQVRRLAGTVDRTAIGGRVGVDTSSGSIEAEISADRLDADAWLPDGGWRWDALAPRLEGFDLALKLAARSVAWRGETLGDLSLDAASSAGGVAVNALAVTMRGMRVTAGGTIAHDGTVSDARLDVAAAHATPFAALLPPGARFADRLWAGPVRLHAEADGPLDALVASASLDLADARAEAHGTVDVGKASWTAEATLRHPGAPRLLEALGLRGARGWVGEGSLSMLVHLSGEPGNIRLGSFDVTAGLLHATGDGAVAGLGGVPAVSGRIAAESLPLPPFDWHAQAPLALGWMQGWTGGATLTARTVGLANGMELDDLSAKLANGDGVLSVDALTARLGGGALTGSVRLDGKGAPPRLAVNLALAGATIDGPLFGAGVDVAGGSVDAAVDVAAQGYGPAAMLASLAGTASLQAAGAKVAGIDLPASRVAADEKGLQQALAGGGETAFGQVAASVALADGVARITRLHMEGPAGEAGGEGTIDLPQGTMSVRLALPDQVSLRLAGAIRTPRRTVEAARVAVR